MKSNCDVYIYYFVWPAFFFLLSSKMSHQISLENDYLGPRRIETLKKEDFDWQKKAQEAVLNIQEFTVKYFEITAKAQKGMVCHHHLCRCQIHRSEYVCFISQWSNIDPGVILVCDLVFMKLCRQICFHSNSCKTRTVYWSNRSASRWSVYRVTPAYAYAHLFTSSGNTMVSVPFLKYRLKCFDSQKQHSNNRGWSTK